MKVYSLYRWADKHFSQQLLHAEVAQAIDYIVKKVGPPVKPREPIVLIGHSLGGASANLTATGLNLLGYRICLLATLDPVAMTTVAGQLSFHGGFWPVPLLVTNTWNWHQTKDVPKGATLFGSPFQSITNILNAKGADGQVLGHKDIDDDKTIANKIRDESLRLHQQW